MRKRFSFLAVLILLLSSSSQVQAALPGPNTAEIPNPMPSVSFFSSLPVHLLGETVESGQYVITFDKLKFEKQILSISLTLINKSTQSIDLESAVQLYLPTYEQVRTAPAAARGNMLQPGETIQKTWVYSLPMVSNTKEELTNYRLLYAPFGWSGPVILYRLTDIAPQQRVVPRYQQEQQAYGSTGDPWKMLVLIYKNIDTTYTENGVQKRLTATMPDQDIENMKNDFLNLPHQKNVSIYSNGTAELEAKVVVIERPLTNLEPISTGYWPSPTVTHPELDAYAPNGKYDSVMIFWQASNPSTGQSIPIYGWGLGYWPFDLANGMTYATVFNIDWVWAGDACQGEVFLHEWLHGVTGFYMWRGFAFPFEDLHGAEEAGYVTDSNGCWKDWLKDYMRGLVYENNVRKALVTQTWHGGSITTYNIRGWRGEYYNNETLYGTPVVIRDDPAIRFSWQANSPHPLVNADHFSSRWTRSIIFKEGLFRFQAYRDDGLRVWLDDVLILDNWYYGYVSNFVDLQVTAGKHIVRVEHYDIDGWASANLNIIPLSVAVTSIPAEDGWTLESGEFSNLGGSMDAAAVTFNVGDDAADRQYRSILSFKSLALPANATIKKVTLKIKLQSVVGTNPFSTHGVFLVDVRKGAFGLSSLQAGDFSATANKLIAGRILNSPVAGWYTVTWAGNIAPYLNLPGQTQFRLRFTKDDNDDKGADILKFYSGNVTTAAYRPQLIIEYTLP